MCCRMGDLGRVVTVPCTVVVVIAGVCSEHARSQPRAQLELAEVSRATRSRWKVQDAPGATARARGCLGMLRGAGQTASGSLVQLEDSNIPCIRDQIVKRPLWHVVVSDWKTGVGSNDACSNDRDERTWDVYVDPESGLVLRATSRWVDGEPRLPPVVDSATATEQMRRASREKYHGFPQVEPKVTLLQALQTIHQAGWAPASAKAIVAEYVIWSKMDKNPRAVWAIMLRGVPVFKPPPGTLSNAQDQYRHIVDAETGEWLGMNNLPRYTAGPPEEE